MIVWLAGCAPREPIATELWRVTETATAQVCEPTGLDHNFLGAIAVEGVEDPWSYEGMWGTVAEVVVYVAGDEVETEGGWAGARSGGSLVLDYRGPDTEEVQQVTAEDWLWKYTTTRTFEAELAGTYEGASATIEGTWTTRTTVAMRETDTWTTTGGANGDRGYLDGGSWLTSTEGGPITNTRERVDCMDNRCRITTEETCRADLSWKVEVR